MISWRMQAPDSVFQTQCFPFIGSALGAASHRAAKASDGIHITGVSEKLSP
jgi:hypothetical protein